MRCSQSTEATADTIAAGRKSNKQVDTQSAAYPSEPLFGQPQHCEAADSDEAGNYGDGAGLYLQVGGAGQRSGLYSFKLNGKPHLKGLGTFADVSLAEPGTPLKRPGGLSGKG